MGRMGPADALRACFAQAEKSHFALLDEPGHSADRILDWDRGIDPMLVIEVDDLDAEPLQARLAGLRDIFRAAVDTVGAAGATGLAEFRGDHDAASPTLQSPTEQLLVLPPAIHVRAVEMVATEIDRPVNQCDPRRVVARPVDAGQRHAAKTDRRDLRPVRAEP